jgi:hypothetical protein
MVTISMDAQTADGERDRFEVPSPMTVRQVICQAYSWCTLAGFAKEGVGHDQQEDRQRFLVHDGDAIRLVGHDGFGEAARSTHT